MKLENWIIGGIGSRSPLEQAPVAWIGNFPRRYRHTGVLAAVYPTNSFWKPRKNVGVF